MFLRKPLREAEYAVYAQRHPLPRVGGQHAFLYLGLNCYLCPEAVNAVKLMLAVEYVTSRVDSTTAKAFNGWSVFGAVRF